MKRPVADHGAVAVRCQARLGLRQAPGHASGIGLRWRRCNQTGSPARRPRQCCVAGLQNTLATSVLALAQPVFWQIAGLTALVGGALLYALTTRSSDDWASIPGPPPASFLLGHLPQVREYNRMESEGRPTCSRRLRPAPRQPDTHWRDAALVLQINVPQVHQFFQQACQDYGAGGIYRLRLGPKKVVVLSEPSLVQVSAPHAAAAATISCCGVRCCWACPGCRTHLCCWLAKLAPQDVFFVVAGCRFPQQGPGVEQGSRDL